MKLEEDTNGLPPKVAACYKAELKCSVFGLLQLGFYI